MAQPNPSIETIDSTRDRLASFRLATERCYEAVLWTQFQNAVRLVIGETDAAIAQQPDHTREREIFTAASWGQGSVRLSRDLEIAHAAKDALHMNADYVTLMFDRYLPNAVSTSG